MTIHSSDLIFSDGEWTLNISLGGGGIWKIISNLTYGVGATLFKKEELSILHLEIILLIFIYLPVFEENVPPCEVRVGGTVWNTFERGGIG